MSHTIARSRAPAHFRISKVVQNPPTCSIFRRHYSNFHGLHHTQQANEWESSRPEQGLVLTSRDWKSIKITNTKKLELPFSERNIVHANLWSYRRTLLSEIKKFRERIRWRTLFHKKPEIKSSRAKKNYGLKQLITRRVTRI